MRFSSITPGIFIFIVCLICSCQTEDSSKKEADEAWASLKDNQARIVISIDGKEFYAPGSIFSGEIVVTNDMFSMTLTDQNEGKSIINLGGEQWFKEKPIRKKIFEGNKVSASVKMGKVIDRQNMIGEGYMMAEGEITALEFSKEKVVLKIIGKAGKYSDFQQPDKLLSVTGIIVYKKPAISFGDITEKEVFGSAPSR